MSSEIVVEIANFPASDAYKADPSVFHPALELIAGRKGALKIWHGLQHEDSSTVYLVIAWEKLSDHEALIHDKEGYAKLGAALAPVRSGDLNLFHLSFKPISIPEVHFNAPITEFVLQTLKEGKANADLEAIVWNKDINTDGAQFIVGKVVEKENQYYLLKGWESVEAHQAARSADPEPNVAKFIEAVRQLVTPTIAHVKLTAYKA